MTVQERKLSQAYEKQNLQGFESDSIMAARVKQLIKDHNINLVIELGSYLGATARRFALMCERVITIEINLGHYTRAKQLLEPCKNVQMFFGDTVEVLPDLLPIVKDSRILMWVDSHWTSNNPLLAELEIIHQSGIKPIICVHDFLVPGHPELGYDTYGPIVYEWDWIAPSIEKIYGVDGYVKEYNSQAEGAKRGIVYIMPK